MNRVAIGFLLLIILTMLATSMLAQQPSEASPNQILVNDALATPGLEVTLHMRFETQRDVKISRLKAEITFPVPQLSLIRIDRPYPVEKIAGEITVEEMESGRIRVEIALPENSPEALPREAIAFLVMRIAEDVEARPLTMGVAKVEMRDLEDQLLEDVQNSQARINVVSEQLYPLISCFFYMH